MSDHVAYLVDTITAKPPGSADGLRRGVATGVTPGATETVVSFMVTESRVLLGFLANSTGDGRYRLKVTIPPAGATTVLDGETNNIERNIKKAANAGMLVPAGSTITLEVTSEAPDTSDYYGTVILV